PEPSGVQLAGSADTLAAADPLPPGTVACAPYTWAGWAEPIRRVSRFRARFLDRFGREPGLPEQEGYDAARVLDEALQRSGGQGGEALVRTLESFRDETYASTPVRLGPDDHVFAEQSHLGLFALEPPEVTAPGEDLDPLPWRPLMRTFTTNGKRVNLVERDVRVFFPNWRQPAPRPNYWRSRFGIVSRPDDPLH
ncbi:MAG TPA: ABC transporter substrate-binding protein, partial [Actinomycetota bacterium]|nr:ABC transporter substrate-binding protein [Actinomycetota bacterium]